MLQSVIQYAQRCSPSLVELHVDTPHFFVKITFQNQQSGVYTARGSTGYPIVFAL